MRSIVLALSLVLATPLWAQSTPSDAPPAATQPKKEVKKVKKKERKKSPETQVKK